MSLNRRQNTVTSSNQSPYHSSGTPRRLRRIVARRLTALLQPVHVVHTKFILIGDNYSLVGLVNLVPKSLHLNFELEVEIFDMESISRHSRYFQKEPAKCEKLGRQTLHKQSQRIRIHQSMSRLFRRNF